MYLNRCIAIMLMMAALVRSFRLFSKPAASNRRGPQSVATNTAFIESSVSANNKIDVFGKDFKEKLKLGVLFLNLGGPETIQDVEGFLYNLFADPDIIRLPPILNIFQAPLAYFIAKRRAPKSSKAYESIGGGSPIVKYTREQSRLVEETLRQKGFSQARCYFAMRYWHPFTEEVLRSMQEDKVDTVVVVPLYPHFSVSTSGSSLKLLQELFYKKANIWGPEKVKHTVVPAWYYRPGYVKVMARLILEQVAQYSEAEMREGVHVLFSAHGVPESYILGGDPYQKHITECVALVSAEVRKQLASDALRPRNISASIGHMLAGDKAGGSGVVGSVVAAAQRLLGQDSSMQHTHVASAGGSSTAAATEVAASLSEREKDTVKPVEFHLSFQSRVGPVQWLRPYTDDKIRELGEQKKVRNLVVVPVSFVSEHIETLEEIDMEYRELAEECGVTKWRRVPALNTDPGFIADLADLVVDALHAPTLTVAEAASKSYSDIMMAEQHAESSSNSAAAAAASLGATGAAATLR